VATGPGKDLASPAQVLPGSPTDAAMPWGETQRAGKRSARPPHALGHVTGHFIGHFIGHVIGEGIAEAMGDEIGVEGGLPPARGASTRPAARMTQGAGPGLRLLRRRP
jgi:hypothetical protein